MMYELVLIGAGKKGGRGEVRGEDSNEGEIRGEGEILCCCHTRENLLIVSSPHSPLPLLPLLPLLTSSHLFSLSSPPSLFLLFFSSFFFFF